MPKKGLDFVVVGPKLCRDLLRNVVGHKTILLRESTFNLWNQKKIDLGFQGNTNSGFAEFLLHSLVQWQFEQESVRMDDHDSAEDKKNRTAANSKCFFFALKVELALLFPFFNLFTIVGDYLESWLYPLFSIPRFRTFPFNTSKS